MVTEGINYKHLIKSWFYGLGDALKVHNSIIFFMTSATVRRRALQCLVLNGFIFLGSIFLVNYILAPLWRLLIYVEPPADAAEAAQLKKVSEAVDTLLVWMYQILWLYPIYCISFILSAIWYQDIADNAYVIFRGGNRRPLEVSFQRWVLSMAEEVYRLLLITSFLAQLTLCSLVPYVGGWLSGLHLCWLYSLYCFEYKWAIEGWALDVRLEYFERRWAYFAGFGFPAAVLTIAFPKFISSGVYAFCFPVFLILATVANPSSCDPEPDESADNTSGSDANGGGPGSPSSASSASLDSRFGRLPIFRFAKVLNSAALRVVQARIRRSLNGSSSGGGAGGRSGHGRAPSSAAGGGSAAARALDAAASSSASGSNSARTVAKNSTGAGGVSASPTVAASAAALAASPATAHGGDTVGSAPRLAKRGSVTFATAAQQELQRQQSLSAIREAMQPGSDD